MTSLSLLLGVAVSMAPAVQRPSVSPTQPEVGEPAIAPARIETEVAMEPAPVPDDGLPPADAPVEPAPEPGPGPEPTNPEPEPPSDTLPSWDSTPTGPVEADAPVVDEWGVPVAFVPVDHSPPKGAGFYAGAGALFGVMVTKQVIMGVLCSDVYCGWRGNFDRVLGLGVMGLSGGGGWFDGRRAAFFELKDETAHKPVIKRRAAGWTLFAVGVAGMLTDTVLYHLCYDAATGPYTKLEGFSYTCNPIASVVVVDFSTLFGAVGMGLGMSAESQLRHRERNNFDLTVAPWGGRGSAGLSLSGRF